nr:MAG TPA: hypothetical protein [Caudoviricetes sp.]
MRATISKSFLQGFIRVLDLSGTKQWPELSGNGRKDLEALRSDWKNVGDSIQRGTRNFKQVSG